MIKFEFLVFYTNYEKFLSDIQEIGTLHVKSQQKDDASADLLAQLKEYQEIKTVLNKMVSCGSDEKVKSSDKEWRLVIESFYSLSKELEQLQHKKEEINEAIQLYSPWGTFSKSKLLKLENVGLVARFFKIRKEKFIEQWLNEYPVKIINDDGKQLFLMSLDQKFSFSENAEEVFLPEGDYAEFEKQLVLTEKKIDEAEKKLKQLVSQGIPVLEKIEKELFSAIELQKVRENKTLSTGEGKLKALEGWVPEPVKDNLVAYLEEEGIYYTQQNSLPEKETPIQLKNSRFSKLFEPIGEMFSLPKYNEVDLTAYFAPFFLVFFGFCLGDAGYGIILFLGATIYKFFASESLKPYLTLGQFFGLATFVMGMLFGTFFGVQLVHIAFLSGVKNLFLDSSKIFSLALILGGVQILFGLGIKIANQIKQNGILHGLGTAGWILIILNNVVFALINPDTAIALSFIKTGINILSVVLILFYTDPSAKIHFRFFSGLWSIYSTVTGIFGDLLSYIRLFALGLSSSILGLVVDQMAVSFGQMKYIGPVLFILILLFGHVANIAISSLGSFVHPMRLTLVEFYKNAGFTGGGKEYRPFSKYQITN